MRLIEALLFVEIGADPIWREFLPKALEGEDFW